jgi:hypothetical protein
LAYILYVYYKEVNIMDKTKTKVLVSILKDSSLYQTLAHDEKISLLLRLEEEYPSLFCPQEDENNEGELK